MHGPADARRQIAVVDDDPVMREATAMILNVAGYQAATFADGESFLSVNGEQAGCVLLDISMPGQSGLDILKELRRRHYRAP
ncbi:MAG TPA: response regulator, partial [Pseudolabrys sp.]|nr:response regulator [Pseudolabrys sp.]